MYIYFKFYIIIKLLVVVHRFIVVDSPESNKLVGVAACSDILSYLVS